VGKILELEEVHRLFGNAFFFLVENIFTNCGFVLLMCFFLFLFFFWVKSRN
jgi:hypothetical protein